MANRRVSELNELLAAQIAADDLILISDVSAIESKRTRASQLQTYTLNGTASWSTNSVSSSHSLTALSASWSPAVVSASYALSASYADFAKSCSFALTVVSASYALSSSWAFRCISASYALTSSVQLVVSSGMADLADSASYLIYVAGFNNGTASAAISASWALLSKSSSFLAYTAGVSNGTASYAMSASNARSASFLYYNGATSNGTASHAMTAETVTTAASASTADRVSNVYFFREFPVITSSLISPSTASFGWLAISASHGNPIVSVDVWGDVEVPITNNRNNSSSIQLLFESFDGNHLVDTATFLNYYTGSSMQQTGSIIRSFALKGQFTLVPTDQHLSASVLAYNGLTIITSSRGVRMIAKATTDLLTDE